MLRVRSLLFSVLLLLVAVAPLAAQDQNPQPKPLKPPRKIIAAEEEKKPDRGFFSSLFHNLGDDLKHMPRKNSLYWLAAGSAGALAIHPADDDINNRLA